MKSARQICITLWRGPLSNGYDAFVCYVLDKRRPGAFPLLFADETTGASLFKRAILFLTFPLRKRRAADCLFLLNCARVGADELRRALEEIFSSVARASNSISFNAT